MTRKAPDSLTAAVAAAFSAAVLCAFPLYIHRFNDLGITKFITGMLLCLVFTAALAGRFAYGVRPRPGRFAAARRDPTVLALTVLVLVNALSTAFSLDPNASLWGLNGYYGGLALVLYTAAAYLAVRAFADPADAPGLLCAMGWAAVLILALYTFNVFGLDPLHAYEGTSGNDRSRFFSTIGNKDFVSGALALMLPPVLYLFLTAKPGRQTWAFAPPALLCTLAFAVVDVTGLLLGVGTAALFAVCCRGFCTRHLQRAALLGAALFGWAGLVWALRRRFTAWDEPTFAVRLGPAVFLLGLLCLAVWALLRRCPQRPLHKAGRVLTALLVAATAAALVMANLWPDRLPKTLRSLLVLDWHWGTGRGLIWHAAAACWGDAAPWRKLLGYGPGMTWNAVQAWAPQTGIQWEDRLITYYAAHNEYLEQLLTTGLLGLAAWLVFVAAHLRKAWQNRRRPAVAAIALGLVSYLAQAVVSIRVSSVFPLVIMLFAWLAVLTAPPLPTVETPRSLRRRAGIGLGAAAVTLVCGAAAQSLSWILY